MTGWFYFTAQFSWGYCPALQWQTLSDCDDMDVSQLHKARPLLLTAARAEVTHDKMIATPLKQTGAPDDFCT